MKYFFLIASLLVSRYTFAQEKQADKKPVSFCGTTENYPNTLKNYNSSAIRTEDASCTSYIVNVSIHIVRNSNGTGGQPTGIINTVMANLATAFNPQKIYFNNISNDEILNDYFASGWGTSGASDNARYNSLIGTNTIPNALNVYLLDDTQWNQGLGNGIPGKALVIGGTVAGRALASSLVVCHEVGHLLNLFHTHHDNCWEGACDETPNGGSPSPNCSTCGDFVCDTPADPNLGVITVDPTTCVWNGTILTNQFNPNGTCSAPAGTYQPLIQNIMSYTPPSCMQSFTDGQGDRMRAELSNTSSILQSVLFHPSLSGPSVLCYGTYYTFQISQVPTTGTIVWSVGNNLTIVNGQNTAIVTVTPNGTGSYLSSVAVSFDEGGCDHVIRLSQSVGTGTPNVSNVLVDNILNPGPVAVNSGSTHYVQSTSSNDPNATYSLSASTNSGNIVLNLTGINAGNCEINVSGSIGNASLNITASNSCGAYTRYVTFYIPSGYSVAPNPAKDNMTLIFDDASYQDALPDQLELLSEKEGEVLQTVDIKDMYAKKLFKSGNQVVFDIHNYPRGIYYLRVTNPRRTDDKKVDVIRLAFE